MESVHLKRNELIGRTEIAVQAMLKTAFPDVVVDYYRRLLPSHRFADGCR